MLQTRLERELEIDTHTQTNSVVRRIALSGAKRKTHQGLQRGADLTSDAAETEASAKPKPVGPGSYDVSVGSCVVRGPTF